MGTPIYDQVQIIQTKECCLCDQLIDFHATRCPYCHAVQPQPSDLKRSVLSALSILTLVVAVSAVGYWTVNYIFVDGAVDAGVREVAESVLQVEAPVQTIKNEMPALQDTEREPLDLDNVMAPLTVDGRIFRSCSAAREVLLDLIGKSDAKSASVFNAIYEGTRICRQ